MLRKSWHFGRVVMEESSFKVHNIKDLSSGEHEHKLGSLNTSSKCHDSRIPDYIGSSFQPHGSARGQFVKYYYTSSGENRYRQDISKKCSCQVLNYAVWYIMPLSNINIKSGMYAKTDQWVWPNAHLHLLNGASTAKISRCFAVLHLIILCASVIVIYLLLLWVKLHLYSWL